MTEHPPAWAWREELVAGLRPLLGTSAPRRPAAEPGPLPALLSALGQRLAADVTAPEDVPALPVSAMDGFAVRCADLDADAATTLPVAADLPAAPGGGARLAPGTAARIMTGAVVPDGADAVVEVERTDAAPTGPAPARVRIGPVPGLRAGRHVRASGEEIRRGAIIAPAGQRVGPGLVAVAAMLGMGRLPLADGPAAPGAGPEPQGPCAAVLVTGDEVLAGEDAPRGQAGGAVRDSNGAMLAAALRGCGARALVRRSTDEAADFRRALAGAAEAADLVVTTGGIGHGAFDVVKAVLGPHGEGTSRFAHLALRPGGPQGWGTWRAADGRELPLVHLPGTPVGALVGFHLFVRPLLGPAPIGRAVLGPVPEDARPRPGRRGSTGSGQARLHALPGTRDGETGGLPRVRLLPGRRLAPFALADALVLVELAPGDELRAGQEVGVIPLAAGEGLG